MSGQTNPNVEKSLTKKKVVRKLKLLTTNLAVLVWRASHERSRIRQERQPLRTSRKLPFFVNC